MRDNTVTVSSNSLAENISDFKRYYGVQKVIAISGGSDQQVDKVKSVIDELMKKLKNFQIAILTGGTKGGIPEAASDLAQSHNIPLIGILPLAGKKYSLPAEKFQLQITVEPSFCQSYWGDESSLFAKIADGAVVIGGGSGTLIEVSHMMKINEKLCKNTTMRMPIPVVPILGVSGVSEVINFLPFKESIRRLVLPENRIFSGYEAADFLIDKMHLYEVLN